MIKNYYNFLRRMNGMMLSLNKPEKPNASDQKYVITANGSRLVQSWRDDK